MTRTTVELSVTATSEELALLSAAAQRRRMSLRDFLRIQVMAAAKLAAKNEKASPTAASSTSQGLAESFVPGALKPAFLP
jgi:hypothetical protein